MSGAADVFGSPPDRRQLICGVVEGEVVDVVDPERTGRVKVVFPAMSGPQDALNATTSIGVCWARVASPMAGAYSGVFFLPAKGDTVLVAFEHGDPSRPYVVGALWVPPPSQSPRPDAWVTRPGGPLDREEDPARGSRSRCTIISRSGQTIVLDDTLGEERIEIADNDGGDSIVIRPADGTIEITAGKGVKITAGREVKITAGRDLEISTPGTLRLRATEIDIQATERIDAGAPMLALQSNGAVVVGAQAIRLA